MNKLVIGDGCKICCECINICSQEVLGIRAGKVKIINLDNCTFCEECVDICPNDAIKLEWRIE